MAFRLFGLALVLAAVLSLTGQMLFAQRTDDDLLAIPDDLATAGAKGEFSITLVGPDDQPIEPKRYVRGIPGAWSVNDFPRVFAIEGEPLFTSGVQIAGQIGAGESGAVKVYTPADVEMGDTVHYRADSSANFSPGSYSIQPFDIPFDSSGTLSADHPALLATAKSLKIRLTPVTFAAVNARTGRPTLLSRLQVMFRKTDLLKEIAPSNSFVRCTLYLPRGLEYFSNLGSFSIDASGRVIPGRGAEQTFKDGVFTQKVTPEAAPAPPAVGKGYWLVAHNTRRVFSRGEKIRINVIVAGDQPALDASVIAKSGDLKHPLGTVALPAVVAGKTDSRMIEIDSSVLAAGKYEIALDHAEARTYALEIVELLPTTPMHLHTVSCCNGADFTVDPAGLAEINASGVKTWTTFGFGSFLGGNPGSPVMSDVLAQSAPPDAPAELKRPRSLARLILDETLSQKLTMFDYAVRRHGWYMEGLAFHHSHPMSVDRTVRNIQLYAQETEDFPAMIGMTYTWFPSLGGYTEGGVPTDPFFGKRMEVLHQKIRDTLHIEPLSPEENKKLTTATGDDLRALTDKQRAWWRAQFKMGFGDHFILYNAKLHEALPHALTTTHENAGHDSGKSIEDMWGPHDAISYESYTDYGDWYMSDPWVVDRAKSLFRDRENSRVNREIAAPKLGASRAPLPTNSNKPVWITIDGTQTVPSVTARAFYLLGRGTEGIGITVRDASNARANRQFAKLNAFLEMYGQLVTDYQPDLSVAVLSNELENAYSQHALYSHLLRLGYAPVVISERNIEERGVPEGVKAIFIPNLKSPFSSACDEGLKKFVASNGKIIQVGEKPWPIDGAIHLDTPLLTIWDVGGFAFQKKFWPEVKRMLPLLEKQCADLGLKPKNGADPLKAVVIPFTSGGVDYVSVVSSPEDTKDTEFVPVEGVKVQVRDATKVLNLVTGETLPIENGAVTLNLVGEPAALLAMLKAEPSAVRISGDIAGMTLHLDANPVGLEAGQRVPMEYRFVDQKGVARATFYYLSGTPVSYLASDDEAGSTWKLSARELLTGISATTEVSIGKIERGSVVTTLPETFITHPDRLKRFLGRKDEVRIIVEGSQSDALAEAQKLADALSSAGRPAKVQQIDETSFDTVWMRWIPRTLDARVIDAIDRDEIVGYRGNMQAFIQKSLRTHIPEKGGWTDNAPLYIVRKDVVLFSGGRLAESLRVCNDWLETPSTPGVGRANLTVALSPFWASKDAVVIVSNDAAGRAKGVATLLAAIATPSALADQPSAVAAAQIERTTVAMADNGAGVVQPVMESTVGSERIQIARPLKGFVPPALVKQLDVAIDGHAFVVMKNSTAIVAPSGEMKRAIPAGGEATMVAAEGNVFRVVANVLRSQESWYFATAWTVAVDRFDAAGAAEKLALAGVFERDAGYPKDWQNAFTVSPDGKTLFAGRAGGGYMLFDLSTKTHRIFHEPGAVLGFHETVRDPVFPTAARFSADGSHIVVMTGHFPTGYGGMGGPPTCPFATSVRMIDSATGAVVWRRDVQKFTDTNLSAYNNALAVSAGGKRVAYIDSWLNSVLLDDKGNELSRTAPTVMASGSLAQTMPLPIRVEIAENGSTVMWALPTEILLSDGEGKNASRLPWPDLSDVRLSSDGTHLYVADVAGGIARIDRAGVRQWTYQSRGDRPKLALSSAGLLVGEGEGNLLLLDFNGQEIRRTPVVVKQPPEIKPAPAQFTGPAVYREPTTLGILKKHGAKELTVWAPVGAVSESFGKKFHQIDKDVVLSAQASGHALVHVAYRHNFVPTDPESTTERRLQTASPSLVIEADGKRQEFFLDLPTPEYRVIDIPVQAKGAVKVTLKAGSDMQVAELSIHGFNFPGANGAYIASANLDNPQGLEAEEPKPESLEPGLDVLDDTDASSVAKSVAGKMKNVKIFSINTDVDRVAGTYFTSSGNPLDTFDGKLFTDGNPLPWTKWSVVGNLKSSMGSMTVIDLGYKSRAKLCATYARTLKQSEVMKGIAITHAEKAELADPTLITDERRVIEGVIENDQFFNLFELSGKEIQAIAIYVFGGDKHDHGLSEVELYE